MTTCRSYRLPETDDAFVHVLGQSEAAPLLSLDHNPTVGAWAHDMLTGKRRRVQPGDVTLAVGPAPQRPNRHQRRAQAARDTSFAWAPTRGGARPALVRWQRPPRTEGNVMIKITRLKITNYRGIKALEADVSGGAIAKGRNGSGKTSVLNAIGAALAAADIGPEAVHIGESDGEILIDLDNGLHVRRRFSATGSTLKITTDAGDTKAKPAALLGELLGSAPIDVIATVLEKNKAKRKELILEGLPVKVTLEQLRRWVPGLPDTFDTSGHGLEVIAKLRLGAYDKRTAANKVAKDAAEALARCESLARANRAAVPVGAGGDETMPAWEEAQARWAGLNARLEASARATERGAALRAQVAELLEKAKALGEEARLGPSADSVNEAEAVWTEESRVVMQLEEKLAAAKGVRDQAHGDWQRLKESFARAEKNRAAAVEHGEQADKIAAGIKAASDPITQSDVDEAKQAADAARVAVDAAKKRKDAEKAEAAEAEAKAAYDTAKREADRLDAVVKKLTVDAPAAILAETPGLPAGIEIDGDDVRLGGVSLDKLCGAEQMRFAASIAKALNPGVGFLVVDGLERLDPEQLEAFVAAATDGGRQLFGSIVDRGDLVLAAIETFSAEVAAE